MGIFFKSVKRDLWVVSVFYPLLINPG